MLFAYVVLSLTVDMAADAVQLGRIQNASLTISGFPQTISGTTCDDCSCAMFASAESDPIVSLNCFENNVSEVICELFTADDYLTSSFFRMEDNSSGRFVFRQLPPTDDVSTTFGTTGIHFSTSVDESNFSQFRYPSRIIRNSFLSARHFYQCCKYESGGERL